MTFKKQKKAYIFIDYDLLIRHFILSGTFKELEQKYEVTYVFHEETKSPKKGIYSDIDDLKLDNCKRFYIPRTRMGGWGTLSRITNLHNQRRTDNYKSILSLYKYNYSIKNVFKTWLCSLPGFYSLYKRMVIRNFGIYQPLFSFIKKEAPDIIIHPSILTGYFINELNLIAPVLGIPLIVLMNSWDNPAVKAATTGYPDKLVVWGEQSKYHAIRYMRMPPENIEIFGPAQFQLYRNPVTETEEELRQLFAVPQKLPILLYAGNSKGNVESYHLDLIEESIESKKVPHCHVVFRPHPWRGPLRKGERSYYEQNYKHITIDPFIESDYRKMINGELIGFALSDYSITKKLLHLVDAVISPLTTLQLESLIFGKPSLVLFIVPETHDNVKRRAQISERLAHFSDFLTFSGIMGCHNADRLPEYISKLIEHSKSESLKLSYQKFSKRFAMLEGPTYGERLVELSDRLIR